MNPRRPSADRPSTKPRDDGSMRPPAGLLRRYWTLFAESGRREPIIDLACGAGRNSIFLASQGLATIAIDRSQSQLDQAQAAARLAGVGIQAVRMDLEQAEAPLQEHSAGGVVVFRYLHRPLMPVILKAMVPGGILVYETFTRDQARFGKPRCPDHLLRPGELTAWFGDWEVIHSFEGLKENPRRAIAQIVCRKPASPPSGKTITGDPTPHESLSVEKGKRH